MQPMDAITELPSTDNSEFKSKRQTALSIQMTLGGPKVPRYFHGL